MNLSCSCRSADVSKHTTSCIVSVCASHRHSHCVPNQQRAFARFASAVTFAMSQSQNQALQPAQHPAHQPAHQAAQQPAQQLAPDLQLVSSLLAPFTAEVWAVSEMSGLLPSNICATRVAYLFGAVNCCLELLYSSPHCYITSLCSSTARAQQGFLDFLP